jgi:putative cofactor-binding repeat protein
MTLSRRDMILSGLGLSVAFAAGPRLARANWAVPSTFGVMPAGGTVDQTSTLQEAIDAAASSGAPLLLPPGIYSTRRLELRSGTHLTGSPGKSILRSCDGKGLIGVEQAENIRLDGLVLDGCGRDMGIDGALFAATAVKRLHLSSCRFLRSGSGAILVSRSENVVIDGNMIDRAATGIAVANGTKACEPVRIEGNLVRNLFFRKIALFHGNGITVEADAMVTGNVVENAPGFGILVGRDACDASVTKNDIRNTHIGIGIPAAIAETALIAGNRIFSVKDGAIRAMAGPTPVGPDLADRYVTS